MLHVCKRGGGGVVNASFGFDDIKRGGLFDI